MPTKLTGADWWTYLEFESSCTFWAQVNQTVGWTVIHSVGRNVFQTVCQTECCTSNGQSVGLLVILSVGLSIDMLEFPSNCWLDSPSYCKLDCGLDCWSDWLSEFQSEYQSDCRSVWRLVHPLVWYPVYLSSKNYERITKLVKTHIFEDSLSSDIWTKAKVEWWCLCLFIVTKDTVGASKHVCVVQYRI